MLEYYRSLRHKLEAINEFIDSQNVIIHVIVLSEIWIYENENINYNLINYTAFFCNRNENRSGGVAIYVHTSLNANKIKSVCIDNNEFLVVSLFDLNINIIGLYKQPSSNVNCFIDNLETILQTNKNFILAGDVNINL